LFEFLEVENNEHKGQVDYREHSKDIPDNQRLTISDLKIINPETNILKSVSFKILSKYSCVPLFTLLPGSKPLLPKHLKHEYRGFIEGKKNVTLYVGMTDPFDFQLLNILRTVTEYSIVSIPIAKEAANIFLNEDFKKIINITIKQPEESPFSVRDVIKYIRNNSVYILFFLIVLFGLISVKLYIKA
jgi:hypothetical protein